MVAVEGCAFMQLPESPLAAAKETAMSTYSKKNKVNPMPRKFFVDREMFHLCWLGPDQQPADESIPLTELQEVRRGSGHKDFQLGDPPQKRYLDFTFTIVYGKEFRTKTLSVAAHDAEQFALWTNALDSVLAASNMDPMHPDVAKHPEVFYYTEPTMVRQFLSTEFKRYKRNLEPKDIEKILRKQGMKMEIKKIKQTMKDLLPEDNKSSGTVKEVQYDFDAWSTFYGYLMKIKEVEDLFKKYSVDRSKPGATKVKRVMTLAKFKDFLTEVQKDERANDQQWILGAMNMYRRDGGDAEPVFDLHAFQSFLMSRHNEAFNSKCETVYQDMTQPLTHYLTNSSHNTYLMGDQLRSESSPEAYVRALRAGCRCVELDCWDGDNGRPIITHGNTLCSKIPFEDVVKVIAEHAFVASEYPVILSLENHCTIPQQEEMASIMKHYFKDMLLDMMLEPNPYRLPSPEQLKRKIILKDKKNPEKKDEHEARASVVSVGGQSLMSFAGALDEDVTDSLNGNLFMQTPDGFGSYYTVLKKDVLVLLELDSESKEEEVEEKEPDHPEYWGELWYHPNETRNGAVAKLKKKNLNGAFLVRPREDKTSWALSYWSGGANHVIITYRDGAYFIVPTMTFASMSDLIEFHMKKPLLPKDGEEVVLTEPIIAPPDVEDEKGNPKYIWYNGKIQRWEAEQRLKRSVTDGSFLVRQSQDGKHFAISFRAGRGIKHCKLEQEGRLYTLGPGLKLYESIADIVQYYGTHPIYRKTCLKHPVNQDTMREAGADNSDIYFATYISQDYISVNQVADQQNSQQMELVKAKYDYERKNDNELSFTKGMVIRVTSKEDGGWWKGECEGQGEGLFMSTYVEPLREAEGPAAEPASEEQAPTFEFKLKEHTVTKLNNWQFQLVNKGNPQNIILLATAPSEQLITPDSEQEVDKWLSHIQPICDPPTGSTAEFVRPPPVNKGPPTTMSRSPLLSDLVHYCCSVKFNSFEDAKARRKPWEMCSFVETKGKKLAKDLPNGYVQHNEKFFSRIYPAGRRVDSSNYDPMPLWICGCQLVALNYQTPGRMMQVNRGRFRDNGNSGYILKPECMRREDSNFDPNNPATFGTNGMAKELIIEIIGGRHLRQSKGVPQPYVEVEIIGVPADNDQKRVKNAADINGLCPRWGESLKFLIKMPELALVRFNVVVTDTFDQQGISVADSVIPATCLTNGYRRVQLFNGYGEKQELSVLFVKITMRDVSLHKPSQASIVGLQQGPASKQSEQELQAFIQNLDRDMSNLAISKSNANRAGDLAEEERLNAQIGQMLDQRHSLEAQLAALQAGNNGGFSRRQSIPQDDHSSLGPQLSLSSINSARPQSFSSGKNVRLDDGPEDQVSMPDDMDEDTSSNNPTTRKRSSSQKVAQKAGHNFKITTFKVPTWCTHCKGFIVGVVKQGYKCENSGCKFTVHKKCIPDVAVQCTRSNPSTMM
eukprot:comp24118_c0_seq1/m.43686 comp24118_c0_seq1/g.43686  ORF comp24118_c0_seq1/g.43686 comp24118_c0_seq1/m.43686 type:complete len:1454 (-) comp24118_c0_seq1:942-5303(-)